MTKGQLPERDDTAGLYKLRTDTLRLPALAMETRRFDLTLSVLVLYGPRPAMLS
jgi:hypothetical protein